MGIDDGDYDSVFNDASKAGKEYQEKLARWKATGISDEEEIPAHPLIQCIDELGLDDQTDVRDLIRSFP